ncbi:MAG: hypothetical protein FWD47_13960 [Treponema sp.]|nr:hypothetical protein [Treponema sp.]
MKVQGCDCSIVIKTIQHEFDVPYSEETIREAVSLLEEEASIEGDGVCKAIVKKSGVTGCVVTPLTIGTAPLLLYLAMGSAGLPVYVSETRSLYSYKLNLLPMEDADCFELIQDRGMERRVFEQCRVQGFELRFEKEQAIKLKLDICGEHSAHAYLYTDTFEKKSGERFNSNNVDYRINGLEYLCIYGLTIQVKKESGTRTEIWIKRTLDKDRELPAIIEDLIITARLMRDKYEYRHFGIFRITLNRLVAVSDETSVNSSDAVIGPVRYYVSGSISTEVFTSGEEILL